MSHKLALLGGTFDPVHIGHLCMAEWVHQTLGLDQVLFVPAAVPPHKRRAITPAATRLRLIERAIAGNPAFGVSTVELEREGPSYTLHTLEHFAATRPDTALWWVIGLDSLLNLQHWHAFGQFPRYTRLAVIPRPGEGDRSRAAAEEHIKRTLPGFVGAVDWVEMPLLEISSTLIRERLGQGLSCRYLLPADVWRQIETEGLYRSEPFYPDSVSS